MIKIGILGYGNLGKGIEESIKEQNDMELVGIFTRRDPAAVGTQTTNKVYGIDDLINFKNKIDVLILCGGSHTDIPEQGPKYISDFNTVDAYDTHANIPQYFNKIKALATQNQKTAIISTGWDPGLFSMMRTLFATILPAGATYSFWGPGVSQGHSEAVRSINGVKKAVQYTMPNENHINAIKNGVNPQLSTRDKHTRVCYVVPETNANLEEVTKLIVTMPNYFADYDTTVNFISEAEFDEKHSNLPHGGIVITTSSINPNQKQVMDFALSLDSNPQFTANVMLAYARANYKLQTLKNYGAFTVLDIPISYLSPDEAEVLITNI